MELLEAAKTLLALIKGECETPTDATSSALNRWLYSPAGYEVQSVIVWAESQDEDPRMR
jgi:hypothetical protein